LQAGGGHRGYTKGHLLATEPARVELDDGIGSIGGILALQLPDGRIVAGGTLDVDDATEAVRGDVIAAIRAELSEVVPETAGLATTHAWTCFRPKVVDELPLVDRVPGCANGFYIAGLFRTGLLMAPVIGRALADWIVSATRPSELAQLGIDRGKY
jgi:glycine/D-amino acid oxidase-like deaminating enzyme